MIPVELSNRVGGRRLFRFRRLGIDPEKTVDGRRPLRDRLSDDVMARNATRVERLIERPISPERVIASSRGSAAIPSATWEKAPF